MSANNLTQESTDLFRLIVGCVDNAKRYYPSNPDVARDYIGLIEEGIEKIRKKLPTRDERSTLERILAYHLHNLQTPATFLSSALRQDSTERIRERIETNLDLLRKTAISVLEEILDKQQLATQFSVHDTLLDAIMHNLSYKHEGEPLPVQRQYKPEDKVNLLRQLNKNGVYIDLEYQLDSNIPYIQASPIDFYWLFSNIISNAIKYSDKNGKIKISSRYDSQQRQIVVEVSDQGIGMSQEFIRDRLFKFDEREARVKSFSGYGIGLAGAYERLKEYGGNIEVESRVNEGTAFRIIIPVKN